MLVIKRKSFVFFWCAVFLYTILLIVASTSYHPNTELVIASIFFFAVTILPIALTNFNWIHPLIFQLIIILPQVFTISCRAVGYIPLSDDWVISISSSEIVGVYLRCILYTCIGLIIEYFFVLSFGKKVKPKQINLRYNNTGILLFLIAVISFYYLMNALGGVAYVLLHFQDRLTEFSNETNLYLRYFVSYGIISVLYFYVMRKKKWLILSFIIQMLMYIAMGERGGLITLLFFPLFIAFQIKQGHAVETKKLVVGLILLVLLYEGFGMVRDYDIEVSTSSLFSNIVDTFAHETHFVISSELLYLMEKGNVDYLWGAPLLNIFVAAFPRKYFPWKPTYIADSALVGSLILGRDDHVFGMPPGNFMWGYLNFGIVGVILFSIVSAWAMRWLYNSFILPYLNNKKPVPKGNILVYVLLVGEMCSILSTEVQIKIIVLMVGLSFILVGSKLFKGPVRR